MISMLLFAAALAAAAPENPSPTHPDEEAIAAYAESNANAGARPFADPALLQAFHGRDGIARIVDETVDRSVADPRIAEIFKAHDLVRLRRTVKEQLAYILGAAGDYSGRDMKASHKELGLTNADFNAFVEDLQVAMDHEHVPFHAQNRLLAKLAPMHRDVVER